MNGFSSSIFNGKRFAVAGLGKNGLPAARALAAMGAGVVAWDDSSAARAAVAGDFTRLEVRDLASGPLDFDALVLSPGIPHRLPKPHPIAQRAIEAAIPILSDTELLFQAVRASGSRARFVGITGTNGKSTTTALLAHILKTAGIPAAAGANLGPAALSLPLLPHDGVYVLEMSSYMLERLATLRFDAAAMLNLSADHIDRHGTMGGYALAKRAIFDRQTTTDLAVIGIDDADSRDMAAWLEGRPARIIQVSGMQPPFPLGAALPGTHNAQNAAAATAMARFLGASDTAISSALISYPGLPHRQQRIVTIDGVTFINDSKATNAAAAARALVCYDRLIWIAGGMAKEGGIEPLVSLLPRIAHAFLIGRDATDLAATLLRHGVRFDIAGTLEAAVPAAYAAAQSAEAPVVLLSPACASWDQFTGYDQRGDRFAALARDLAPAALASPGPGAGNRPGGRV